MRYDTPEVKTVGTRDLLSALGPAQALIYFDRDDDSSSGSSGSVSGKSSGS